MNFNPKKNPDAKRVLQGLYEFKAALVKNNKAFSREEFLRGLKEIGIPSNAHFWMTILSCELPEQKCKLLTRVRKNAFVFTKPNEPIYWGDLQVIYDAYARTVKRYKQNKQLKKRLAREQQANNELAEEVKVVQQEAEKLANKPEDEQLSAQIREAIKLLKANGFEVLAPIATLYAKV